MSDRISLSQIFTQGLRGILDAQSQVNKTQGQVSSGKRVLQPSDDPVAAAQILQLDHAQSEIDQYKKNIAGATNSLGLEDTQLDNVSTSLTRVRELAVQAGDGALSQTERKAIAAELAQRLNELGALANTRNTNGEYIFAGFQGQQMPFVQSGTTFTYYGDSGQRYVQISSSTSVPVNDSGKDIFVAVPTQRLSASVLANTGDATMAMGQIANQNTFASTFAGPYSVSVDTTAVPPSYQIDAIPATATPLQSGPFTSGQPITFNGAQIDIVATTGTATFKIDAPSTQDMFTTVGKLVNGLNSLTDSDADKLRLRDLISETLDNLDNAGTNVDNVRAKVGARLNILDSTSSLQDGLNLTNQKVLSQVQDLDYASAISQLNQENLVLQAAQQSFAKIAGMSLFDFLR